MEEQRWKGNVNDNENTNSWPNETRSRHGNWSAAALGPGPTNLHQSLEPSARSSADSTVGSSCIFFRRRSTTALPFHSQDRRTQGPLTQSRQNGDFKPSEGGFGGITELWINQRGQGAATTTAQAGAERSLLCGAHYSILVVGKGGQGPEPKPKVALGTWPEHSKLGFGTGSLRVPRAPAVQPMTRYLAAM
ncbi:hypothetical protein FBULB1_14309 [Fusarium bulbicola]|nr:hypothetical protein FBULB1_14309 [Fusarium bulbicola]